MKLRALHEAQDLQTLGNLIAFITDSEKIDQYLGDYPKLSQIIAWFHKMDPKRWDNSVSKEAERFGTYLTQKGSTDGPKWQQIGKMPGTTVASAVAAAPDGMATKSIISGQDVSDGVSTPIRDKLGDEFFGSIAGVLAKNRAKRDLVLRTVSGSLGTLTSEA
jgi:hypothetical protein